MAFSSCLPHLTYLFLLMLVESLQIFAVEKSGLSADVGAGKHFEWYRIY